jgi:ubiquinone/menaquinone biosynthesis C-methylase UbiE
MDAGRRLAAEIAHGRWLREHRPPVWHWATPAARRRADRRTRQLVEDAQLGAGRAVLELGCGDGFFTARLGEASGARVIGVDVSPDLLAAARERLPAAEFVRADAHRLPFAAASFDAVVGSSVLHHLEPSTALAEARRVLKPGGRIAFAEPNLLNPQVWVEKKVPWVRRWLHEPAHETGMVRWHLVRMLRAIGFEEVTVVPRDFLHPWTPKPLIGVVVSLGAMLERLPLAREIAGSVRIAARRPDRDPLEVSTPTSRPAAR